jgi:PAS domain S-box-containing protein
MPNLIRILMIEECRQDVALVRDMLRECRKFTWQLEWAREYDSALKTISRGGFDLLLVNHLLGRRSGLDLLSEPLVGESGAAVVVISGRGDYDADLAAMEAGAMDYLVKGQFDSVMLERSIRYAVSLKRSRNELIKAGETLEKMVAQRTEELVQAKEEAESSLSLLQAILGQMPVGVVIVEPSGSILLTNRQAEEIVGSPINGSGCMAGRINDIFHPDGSPLAPDEWPLARSLRDDTELSSQELIFRRRDGTQATVSVSPAPVRDCRGRVMAGVIMLEDITERRRSEEELLSIHADLEERVRSRTLELEGASRAKSEFLANMSHEIRTPMSGILGMTEIILQRGLTRELHQDLSIIRDSTRSMLTLLNDLLDLSRIEKGSLDLRSADFDLSEVVDSLVRPFELQAMEKGLTFGVVLDQDLPFHIHGDPDRLGQVLKNLLQNALKFTEDGGIRLRVRKHSEKGCSVSLLFSVTDTGIGISLRNQKKLFTPFTQLDLSRSKRYAGSGLGLAICRQLVRLMGGDIRVESRKGAGAIFSFTAQFKKGRAKPENQSPECPLSLSDLPSLSILLAEDNLVNRLFLCRALTEAGHRVSEAENGQEVLELLPLERFDCILMDVQMPVMDGIKATSRIRSSRSRRFDPRVPIIALTAFAMKGDREKFLSAGMNGYVSKPVDFAVLARTIEQVTNGRGAAISRQQAAIG